MRSILTWATATLLALASAHGEPDLKHEHRGDVFGYSHTPQVPYGVLHNGNSTGQTGQFGNVSLYLSYPPGRRPRTDIAVIYLTDIFGPQLVNNRLLADSIAKAGYFVVMPDLFRGDPVPADALSDPNSTFNMTAWRTRHPMSDIENIISTAISTTKSQFASTKLGAVGYCFGGRYVARYLAAGKGIDAGFTAHPSSTTSEEWQAVASPISIAFGALDTSNNAGNRSTIEGIFTGGNKTFQTALYSNAEHGFAVRTDLTTKQKAFAQESAYFQAVRWLDAWVKGYVS